MNILSPTSLISWVTFESPGFKKKNYAQVVTGVIVFLNFGMISQQKQGKITSLTSHGCGTGRPTTSNPRLETHAPRGIKIPAQNTSEVMMEFLGVGRSCWFFLAPKHQVGFWTYCWWFRNPARKPPGMELKPVVNSGISTTSTGAGFLPSTVSLNWCEMPGVLIFFLKHQQYAHLWSWMAMPTVMRSREISEWKPHGWTGSVGRNGLDTPQNCTKYFVGPVFAC